MVKVKSKGKKKSSLTSVKKNVMKKKVMNPFEVHVNRQKHDVLGRQGKNDRGLPGVSRSKAMKKRKVTLLHEYNVKDKSNKFMDRRIGEKNRAMTGEDRIMARFAAERMKSHNKKTMFNLADDEVLTHHGQTLNELEQFDDPRSEDEDEHDEGKLDAAFVKNAHFGGGMFTRSGDPQSRKDLIEQLIVESKKRKMDQKKSREQTQDLTDKLDTEWKDLLPIIATSRRKPGFDPEQPREAVDRPDEYDTMMRELKFEARGNPSDRLKSEDEIAKDEKERLEKLEADRLLRMHGIAEAPKTTHRSADDLDDGFAIESDGEEPIVCYDADGKLNQSRLKGTVGVEEDMETEGEEAKSDGGSGDDGESSDDDEEEDEESDEDEDDLADLKIDSDEEQEGEEKEPSKSSEVHLKNDSLTEMEPEIEAVVPAKSVSVPSNEEENNVEADVVIKPTEIAQVNEQVMDVQDVDVANQETEEEKQKKLISVENFKKDLLARKLIMETARKELPYTFDVPENYEDLHKLFVDRSPEYQAVILERIIKCTHPSLANGNKDKLATLLAFLLQHLHDVATQDDGECFVVLDRLAPHLYDLAVISTTNARRCMAEVLKEKQSDYRNQPRIFPTQDTLVFLKLVSLLFPTSDFRHPVVTPSFVFIGQMLSKCRTKTRRDVAVGLFLSTMTLEYTVLSKRFSPEVIDYLGGLLRLATEKSGSDLLTVPSNYALDSELSTLSLKELSNETLVDNSFRYRALLQAINLLDEFCSNLSDLPAALQVFQPILDLKAKKLPIELKKKVASLKSKVKLIAERSMPRLVPEAKKPKSLRLYEPSIVKVFDGRKHRVMSQERQEREKLLHKVKRETKGAVREIRRDRMFLAKIKIKETLKSDMERKAKVKEIYGSAAMQQGDINKLARRKKYARS